MEHTREGVTPCEQVHPLRLHAMVVIAFYLWMGGRASTPGSASFYPGTSQNCCSQSWGFSSTVPRPGVRS